MIRREKEWSTKRNTDRFGTYFVDNVLGNNGVQMSSIDT